MSTKYINKSALISPCQRYRYTLSRLWDESLPVCTFIGLNPSTADANEDDATIRRCVAFAAAWGCGELVMVNLFPLRSTDPKGLYGHQYSAESSLQNSDAVDWAINNSAYAIAAWGAHGKHMGAGATLLEKYRDRLHYLRLTKAGDPGHPLYLPGNLKPIPYRRPEL